MSFDSLETSLSSSQPVELYDFTYQGLHLYFTSTDIDKTVAGIAYKASHLQRSKLTDSGDISKSTLNIVAEEDFAVSGLFEEFPPDDVVGLVLSRMQSDGTIETFWLGRVVNVAWPSNTSTLRCESIFSTLKQPGLRRPYGRNCPYTLYDEDCQLHIADFQSTLAVTSQTGNILTIADAALQADGFFAGGRVYWEASPGFFVKRGIVNHTADQIEITHQMPGISGGANVVIAPGCAKDFLTCDEKFANAINFGGDPNMQQKNPFGQSNVF